MKIKKNNKKGFTIVELVIVIAVIGILAAILIPTFISLNNKARMASTESFLKNINTQIAMKEADEDLDGDEVGSFETMYSAVEYAKKKGFDLEEISPFAGNEIVWDEVNHRFAFVNGETINYSEKGFSMENAQYMPDSISDLYSMIAAKKKVYVKQKLGATGDLTVYNSFDAGANNTLNSVTYIHGEVSKVIIRSNGDHSVLNVKAPTDDVMFYGFAKTLRAQVAPTSLHVFGAVSELAVEKGHVEVEETGIVFDVVLLGNAPEAPVNTTNASITNKGYIADTTFQEHYTTAAYESATAERKAEINSAEARAAEKTAAQNAIATETPESKRVSGNLEIASLAALESFRDAVNAGNSFFGKTVELKANLTLNDGWSPIGEGSRKTSAGNSGLNYLLNEDSAAFKGEFDGNGHTISNLNNIGFVPTEKRLGTDDSPVSGAKTYAYGFFGITASGANIHDLTFAGVNIDTTTAATNAYGDSIGAVVGYASGSITLSNITVKGSVKGHTTVGGVIGRAYGKDGQEEYTFIFNNLRNEARVENMYNHCCGILGLLSEYTKATSIQFTNNANVGTIVTPEKYNQYNAGICNCGTFSAGNNKVIENNTNNGVAAEYNGTNKIN